MAIALPYPTSAEWPAITVPQEPPMSITEMLAPGCTRDEVTAMLVRDRICADIGNARFMIAFALGETTGNLCNVQERDFDLVGRGLSAPASRQSASGCGR